MLVWLVQRGEPYWVTLFFKREWSCPVLLLVSLNESTNKHADLIIGQLWYEIDKLLRCYSRGIRRSELLLA